MRSKPKFATWLTRFFRRGYVKAHDASYHPGLEPLEERDMPSASPMAASIRAAYGRNRLSFEANQGQADPAIRFLARGQGYTVLLAPTAAIFDLFHPSTPLPAPASGSGDDVLRMRLVGGNPDAAGTGQDPLPGAGNDLFGADRSQGRTEVPAYGQVDYRGVYPGIDLLYHSNRQQLEYDFNLAAGADPACIDLAFDGTTGLAINGSGDLVAQTATGGLVEHAPVLYQEVGGIRQPVAGRYALRGGNEVGFQVGPYDHNRPLVIDPVLHHVIRSDSYEDGSDSSGNGSDSYDNGSDSYDNGSDCCDNGSNSYDNGSNSYDNGSNSYDNGSNSYDNGSDNSNIWSDNSNSWFDNSDNSGDTTSPEPEPPGGSPPPRPPDGPFFAVAGAPGHVQVRRLRDGSLAADFTPYGRLYTGGISIALGDVEGDGFPDLVTAPLAGNPQVKVYSGHAFAHGFFNPGNPDASLVTSFFAYGINFNVGANVAIGDVSGNGFADIVTGATMGNPQVKVYDGQAIAHHTFNGANPDASLLASFFAYGLEFNIGANVAVGDVNHDGFADVVTGATAGNPQVKVYDGKAMAQHTFNIADPDASLLASFFAFGLQYNVGAFVSVGDVTGSGYGDVIVGASTGNPQVKVYDGQAIANHTFNGGNPDASLLTTFYAYGLGMGIGTSVSAANADAGGPADILTGAAQGTPRYRLVRGLATGIQPPAEHGIDAVASDILGGILVGA